MSAADRSDPVPVASDVAGRLRDAAFVRLVASPDGDALAATGVIARAHGGPFQATVTRRAVGPTDADATDADATDADPADADLAVNVGLPGGDVALTERPLSVAAAAVADELEARPERSPLAERLLALAGVVAAGDVPGEHDLLAGADFELERTPGVARPTDDVADAFAHTTLAHAAFSGDPDAAHDAADGLEHPRTVASALALASIDDAPDRAADAVQRALRPHDLGSGDRPRDDDGDAAAMDAPFVTLEGYADVLDACAQQAPGVGVALALGHDVREAALDAWRDHAVAVHRAVRDAELSRHRGLVVASVSDGADEDVRRGLASVARLVRDFRSAEPVVVAVAAGPDADTVPAAVAAAERTVAGPVRDAADAVGGTATGHGPYARATIPTAGQDAFVEALRRAVT